MTLRGIVVASAAFAATLTLTLAAAGLCYLAYLHAQSAGDPADNAAIRSAGLMLVEGIPAAAVIAYLVAVPLTSLMCRSTLPAARTVAALPVAMALAAGLVLSYPASGFAPPFSPERLLTIVALALLVGMALAPASLAWWIAVHRSRRESGSDVGSKPHRSGPSHSASRH